MTAARVLHVLGTGLEEGTAIANIVTGLARHLDSDRYDLSACFLHSDGPLRGDFARNGVTVIDGSWRYGWRDMKGARNFGAALRHGRFDIVHFHAGGMSTRVVAKSATGAKVVAHYHSLAEESRYERGPTRRTWFADLVIANSRATAETFRSRQVLVIPPGIDVHPVSRRTRNAKFITVGVAARLVPIKRIDVLLDAMHFALHEAPTLRLEIAGAGPDGARLKEKSTKLGLDNVVRFLGWRRDVRTLMERWDIYVQPSVAEGFGVAVLEAMATGLPVIASNAGGLSEIVMHDRTGYLVPAQDPRSIAMRLIQLARDHNVRERLGSAGREHAARSFTLEQQAARISAAYERVLS